MVVVKKKKTNSTKKCIIKRRLKFEEYNKCLQNNKIMLRSQWFKSEAYNYSTEKVNKIASRLMMIKAYNHLTE